MVVRVLLIAIAVGAVLGAAAAWLVPRLTAVEAVDSAPMAIATSNAPEPRSQATQSPPPAQMQPSAQPRREPNRVDRHSDRRVSRSKAFEHRLPPMPPMRYSHREVTLERAADSHFYATVEIDGTKVRMLVDSGASRVALTRSDAERIGIEYESLRDGGYASTAGGVISVRIARIQHMAIHNLEARDVDVVVFDQDVGISLLGQDYLARLSEISVRGNYMTLRQ